MKESKISNAGTDGNNLADWHITGLDPESVKILANTVNVPAEKRLSSIDSAISGINRVLIMSTDTGVWFDQKVKLITELERTKSKLENK